MDKGLYTGVVLLDIQKAFDTVDHDILQTKLCAIGANNNAVNWFSSYLSDRKQFVQVNGTLSSRESVTCGVPQGSILGPLLFTLYVNDMSNAVNCELCLYADDSMLQWK
jgi:retron-type reverse transcriptase